MTEGGPAASSKLFPYLLYTVTKLHSTLSLAIMASANLGKYFFPASE